MTLKTKTITSLIWAFIQQFSVQLISFGITIGLARILMPAEFGMIAMLTILVGVGNTLLDSGLASSLIRSTDLTQRDFSTVFFFNLAGSIVIYGITYVLAPMISRLYHQPLLVLIIRVYTLDFIINAFFSVQNARLIKDMNFKAQMMIQIPAVLLGGLLGIYLAITGHGVWSLVWLGLAQSFLSTVMHWLYSGWLPSLVFDKQCFRRHFGFGYKMTLTGLLDIVYRNIYVVIIGSYYSITQLGFYNRAESFSQLPVNNISMVIHKVTYPMFTEIGDDDKKLKRVYRQIMQQVIFWVAPILIIMIILAEPLFTFLLTDKWLPAVPFFQILCLAGIMYPLNAYNLNILKVKGRSDLILKLETIKKAICLIGIFCATYFGIYGLLYFQLIFSVLAYYINSAYSSTLIGYPVKEQFQDLWPIFAAAMISGLITYLIDELIVRPLMMANLARILTSGFTFCIIYLSTGLLFKLIPINDFKILILKK
jgi:O-antigen/teichoic acid export membrane protein